MRSSSNSCGESWKPHRTKEKDKQYNSGCGQNRLYIIGLGPGSHEHLSQRALEVLEEVDIIAGYTTYIDLIAPLIKDKPIITTPMRKEIERIKGAVNAAMEGKSCAVVSSGDAGVYAMAGLVFEICKARGIPVFSPGRGFADHDGSGLQIEVVPGIPALCSGASLLGAPLNHDFASISLSDLLTPWETIEKRIEAAAMADFVMVLFNPKSKKRNWQLNKAQEIILKYRDKNTPVGIVTGAMRKDEKVEISMLKDLHKEEVNMQTTVFIGNSRTIVYMGYLITPRGYRLSDHLNTYQ